MYTYDSTDKYWHDDNSYKEIGELHTTKRTAVVGKIDSRYSNNKKKSILSPDSDRIIYNYFSNPNVKDCDVVKETTTTSEKQVYVGRYFLAIYDANKGNFICENPKSFLKKLLNPISEGGLGLNESDFEALCLNMKYVNVYGEYAYVTSALSNGKNVMFRLNTNTYEVESYHASNFDNFIGNVKILSRPFNISSNIYYLCKDGSSIKCYYVDTYHDNIFESDVFESGLSNLISSNTPENGIVSLSDEKRGYVYFFAAKSSDYAKVYNINSGTFVSLTLDTAWPFTSNDCAFTQYILTNDSNETVNDLDTSYTLNRDYIVLLSNNNYLIKIRPDIPQLSFIKINLINGKINGFYRSVVEHTPETSDDANYRYHLNLICTKTDETKVYIDIDNTVTEDTTYDISSFDESIISDMYSDLNIYKNVFNTNGSNIIIGDYLESGRRRPLIKDVDNDFSNYPKEKYLGNGKYKTPRKGLEPENGVNIVKNISFGDTIFSRIRLTPESAAEESAVIQDKNAQMFMREDGSSSDGKYTTGSLLWKALANTGIPYNTHVQSVGRIIIDGKDIPIENVLITPPSNGNNYGSTLLTIDKLFDITKVSDSFVKNGKALYPGILFKNDNGFISDSIISNVYNMDGSFAYNDNARGNLLASGLCEIKASCIVNTNDDQYLLVATNFGKIASLNIKTGGYTKYTGENIGENAPNFYLNLDNSSWESNGDIVCIEQYVDEIFVFFANGSVFRATIEHRVFSELETNNDKSENAGIRNVTRLCKRNGNAVFSISNNGSGDQCAQVFNFKYRFWSSYTNTYIESGEIYFDENTYSIFVNNSMYILNRESIQNNICYITLYELNTVSGCLSQILNIEKNTNYDSSNAQLGLVYDNNERIYILTDNTFGYYDINKNVYLSLNSYTTNSSGNTEIKTSGLKYYNDGTTEYVSTLTHITHTVGETEFFEYKYNVSRNSWSYSSTITLEELKDFQKSTQYNNNFYYYTEGSPRIFKVKDIRSGKISVMKPLYYKWPTGKYITAIGFANNGTNLVFTFENGDIGSFTLPTNEYVDPDTFTTYVRYISDEHSFTSKSDFLTYAQNNVPTKNGYTFDYWSLESNGDPLPADLSTVDLPDEGNVTVYAVFHDSIEAPTNTSIRNIFNRGMLDEGATDIYNIGKDVIFATSTKSIRFSEEVGCFFKGRDDKFTNQYVESDKGIVKDNKPVSPLPLCNAGMCTVGKYIIYVNGYNKFADLPSLTCHNGVVVYDTEYDEYAVLYSGLDNVHGTTRAKINPACYYFDGYIYSFGGLERIDEHKNGENYTRFKRTNKIEQIDLISGTIKELSDTYGYLFSYNNDPTISIDDDYRILTRKGDTLVGYINYDNSILNINHKFTFDLINKTATIQNTGETNSSVVLYNEYHLGDYDVDVLNKNSIKNHLLLPININKPMFLNNRSYLLSDSDGYLKAYDIISNNIYDSINFTSIMENRKLFEISNSNYEKLIPSVIMDDGRIFIECSPKHAEYDVNMLSYSHIIVDPKDFDSTDIDTNISSSNYIDTVAINDDYYCLSHENGIIRIDNYDNDKEEMTPSNELEINLNLREIKTNMVVCNDTIYTFIVINGELDHILAYSIDTCKLKELNIHEADISQILKYNYRTGYLYTSGYRFKYNKYFDSVYSVRIFNDMLWLMSIRDTNEETLNSKENINIVSINLGIRYDNDVVDYDLAFNKNEVIIYLDNKVLSIELDDYGSCKRLNKIVYDNNYNYICSRNLLHSENGKITSYELYDGPNIIKRTLTIKETNYRKSFNSMNLNIPVGTKSFVCNDSKYVYTVSEDFKYISKTSLTDGSGNDFRIDSESTMESNPIRDAVAINEILYMLREDGKMLKYNTTNLSLSILNCLDFDTSSETVQMCSGNEYVYILRENKLSRFSSLDNTVKTYDEFNYFGIPLSVRFISDLNEIRFATKNEAGTQYNFYSFNVKEKIVRKLNKYDVTISNQNEIVHFDDYGNIIIILNDSENYYFKMINGSTFDTESFTNSNKTKFENVKDISVINDISYMIVGNDNSQKLSLTKCPLYFNYIRPNKISSNSALESSYNIFSFNKDIYYLEDSGIIQKFNPDDLTLTNYSSNSIFTQNYDFSIDNIIGIKVFLNGVVYIVGYKIMSEGVLRLISIGYNLKTKQIENRSYKNIVVTGLTNDGYEKLIVSQQASWSSRYVTFTLKVNDSNYNKCLTLNVFNSTIESEFDIGNDLPVNGCVNVFNGISYIVGGEEFNINNESSLNEKIHANFGIINNVASTHVDYNSQDPLTQNSTMIKSGKSTFIFGFKTFIINSNGVNPFTINDFGSSKINVKDEDFLHGRFSSFVPLQDDVIAFGLGENQYGRYTYKIPESPSCGLTKNRYNIRVYSGSTKDTFISSDTNGNIISKIDIERDYGTSVKNIINIDNNRSLIIYSNTPNVGTLLVHDNGSITIKRYDGTIFGEAINTGTNIHTIQEVDLTMLFDSESNESREVSYAN